MPKRTSNEIKKLQGTDSPGRIKPVIESAPIDPNPVAGLDAIAAAEWKRITEASSRFTELDQALLALYCSAFSRWKRAEDALVREGEVVFIKVRDTHGKVTHKKPIANPMLRVAEAAGRAAHRYGDALGLSPASRVKQGFEHRQKTSGSSDGESLLDILKREHGEI